MAILHCPLCAIVLPNLGTFVSHLRQVHAKDTELSLNCSAEGCFQTFRTVSAYSSHVYRSHREQLGLSVSQEANEHDQRSVCLEEPASTFEYRFGKDPVGPDEIQYTIWHNLGTDSVHPQLEAAKFLLKLKEVRHVSERTIGDVITGCKFLLGDSLSVVKASVKDSLQQAGIDMASVDGLESIFANAPNPFSGLETSYLREKYFKDQFGLLVSSY